VEKTAY